MELHGEKTNFLVFARQSAEEDAEIINFQENPIPPNKSLFGFYSERSLGAVKNNTKRITEPSATRPNATNSIVLIKTP